MKKDTIVREISQCILNRQDYEGVGTLGLVEEALLDTPYRLSPDWDTNGWEVDFWAEILDEKDEVLAKVTGSMYYGDIKITCYVNE